MHSGTCSGRGVHCVSRGFTPAFLGLNGFRVGPLVRTSGSRGFTRALLKVLGFIRVRVGFSRVRLRVHGFIGFCVGSLRRA